MVAPATAKSFDLKLLTKPTHFDCDPRGWPIWSFAFENWLICHDAEFETEMTAAVGGAVAVYAVSEETKARSVQLYAIMAGMLTGRALAILKSVPGRNGYEAFRQLYQSCAPKSHNRHLALLMSVTQAAAFSGSDEVCHHDVPVGRTGERVRVGQLAEVGRRREASGLDKELAFGDQEPGDVQHRPIPRLPEAARGLDQVD